MDGKTSCRQPNIQYRYIATCLSIVLISPGSDNDVHNYTTIEYTSTQQ